MSSPVGPSDLQVETPPPGASFFLCQLLYQRIFMRSSGFMLAQHATNQGCLVFPACFTIASIKTSFLGVQPSECKNRLQKTCRPPWTFTHACAILLSFPGIDVTAPSSVKNCSQTAVTATKLLPTCACDPYCLPSRG